MFVIRRERSSLTKHEPGHEQTSRHHRHEKIADSSSEITNNMVPQNYSISKPSPPGTPLRKTMVGQSFPIDSNPFLGVGSSSLCSSSPNRRQSTPYESHQIRGDTDETSDVVTAILKLPLQSAATALNLDADFFDITYIDVDEGTVANSSVPLRQSRSTPTIDRPIATSSGLINNSSLGQYGSYKKGHLTVAHDQPIRNIVQAENNVSNAGNSTNRGVLPTTMQYNPHLLNKPVVYPTEQATNTITTDKSGNVSRSKTADFERLFFKTNRRVKDPNCRRGSGNQPSKSVISVPIGHINNVSNVKEGSAHDFKTKSTSDNSNKSGPIYKRHDVISSAQTSKK